MPVRILTSGRGSSGESGLTEIWPVVAGFTSAGVLMLLCVASLGWSVVWLIKFAGGLP